MFRGFKFQVVLPVAAIALLLISIGAIGFSLWAMQHEEAQIKQQVADNVTSVRGVFVTTAALMDERVRMSMALLKEQINARGGAEKGGTVTLAGKPIADIIVAGRGQAGNFDIVDYVTRLDRGTATIFSKDGERFVRVATNVLKDDGSRAVGTELNNTTKAYAALSHGQAFYGVVDILGNPYITGYEPLNAKNGDFIGINYVGYKAELPVLSQSLEQSRLLNSGFVAVVDSKTVRYAPSWVTKEEVQEHIDNKDGSWTIERVPLEEWGLTIISAYPVAELHSVGRKIGFGVALAGLVIGAAISIALFFLLDWKVLQLLGGEPRVAAEYMKKIAAGDLAVEIAVAGKRPDSLMASLKLMQMKLKNLILAVSGAATEVNEQSRKFESTSSAFQRSRDETTAQELLRQTKGVGKTLALLEKAISRFKL
ncbi:MAG TPA: Cache 3/Cache 2 fusion domain-containing protein [Steroidobacteraceae bacterium]|nr:Cache 3/Cache 2 fusion domain-containing protein [Steroidobacteraceae bacterium]